MQDSSFRAARVAPRGLDWLLLAAVTVIGGSSFVLIRSAVETMLPLEVAGLRLWVGAVILYAAMRHARQRFPRFFVRARGRWRVSRRWRYMIAAGTIGNAAPFLLFPWAQQYVDSGLAGVYMAFMPIWTVGLAYAFAGEAATPAKILGFALGLIGVLVIMGLDAIREAGSADARAQGALLLATFCYAAAAVIIRRAPPIGPRVFSTGIIVAAAVAVTPPLILGGIQPGAWSMAGLASVLALGVFPTGINAILGVMLIRRVGAGFSAIANYFTPVWALFMGVIIYAEALEPRVIAALVVILAGVAISQRR